jgi:hypothetical protein
MAYSSYIFVFCIYSQTCLCGHPYWAVTCIKRSPFSCPVTENFIWIEHLLRGHLAYKTNFSLSQRWPLNTGLTSPKLALETDRYNGIPKSLNVHVGIVEPVTMKMMWLLKRGDFMSRFDCTYSYLA